MKKIHVVHITEAWKGGIATYVETLMEQQIKSTEFGRVSLIYSSNRTEDNLEQKYAANPKVSLFSYKSSRNPIKFYEISNVLEAIISELNPGVIHLHSSFPGAYIRMRKLKYPVVYCAHCWAFARNVSVIFKFFYGVVEFLLAKRKPQGIIFVSQYEQNLAKKYYIEASKIDRVIYSGVRDRQTKNLKLKCEFDPACINVGFIGRLDYEKGYDLIEPYFKNVAPDHVKLYVMGDVEIDTPFAVESDSKVHYLGWIGNDEVDSYIAQCDILIVPSRYEAFGLVVVEAMRNSKPVIVSSMGGLPELVTENYNGYVIDIADINKSLSNLIPSLDKSHLRVMGDNARITYEERFTRKHFADEIYNFYMDLLLSHE